MHINENGQVTIPPDLRESLGLAPHTEIEFVQEGERLYLRKKASRQSRGQRLVAALRGKGHPRMSTDELMNLTRGPTPS